MLRDENKTGQREIGDVGSAAERGNQTEKVETEGRWCCRKATTTQKKKPC